MNKLVSAEFSRLLKSLVFKLCLMFSAGFGIFFVLMRWTDIKQNPDTYASLSADYSSADGLIFAGGLYLIFAVAVFISIFVGTEYSDGTIRNKLTAGHTRRNIYFSKLIVCATAGFTIHILYILTVLVFGNIMLGITMATADILSFTAVSVTAILALAAFLLLCSMSIQSKASGAVTALLTTLIMLFAALTIAQRLAEPEYYEPYSFTDGNTGETIQMGKEKNPHYLTGTKRKVYEFFNNFLPVSQLYQVVSNIPDNLHFIVIYDCLIFIASTGAGIIIFRKKNLK